MNLKNKHITFIIYDSITNSVFESVVLHPILKLIENSENLEVTLISFESFTLRKKTIMRRIPAHDKLHLVLCRRLPFMGKVSLRFARYQLAKILKHVPSNHIIARGPLAGWVALKVLEKWAKKNPERMRSLSTEPLPELSIQARGLAAEEYRFYMQQKPTSWLKHKWHTYIFRQLLDIEFEAYRNKRKTDYPHHVTIEAVSTALKEYLVHHFRSEPARISIAHYDLPTTISVEQRGQWRDQVRKVLGIADDCTVYAYSGSAKPWQCITEMLLYFMQKKHEDAKSVHFLVLTQDKKTFELYCKQAKLDPTSYTIMSVAPIDVFKYLSAADAGLLFRRKDIINWVARPTKMLEYQAVGLEIIHNDTVAMLVEKEN